MDAIMLSRIQFAVVAAFHFIFVPITLGLSVLVAYMETKYVRTGDEMYLRMTKFWGKLFVINFVIGVVTGLTLEFQFGMNWAEYSKYVGDIFGAPLAIEATVAFFLESTFIGLWVFGWDKVSKKVHALSIWLVALASNLSAVWILLANGWMQHPVGYAIRGGRAEMVDFGAMLANTYSWYKFFHTVLSGFVVSAFFVMAVSAWHILRKSELKLFKASFRTAAAFGLVCSVLLFVSGDLHGTSVAETQPTKLAAMESIWETRSGAPFYLLLVPDPENERNAVEALGIPGLLSFLSHHDWSAEIKGLKEFPADERPPVVLTFASFRGMIGLGFLFILLALLAFVKARRERLESSPGFLRLILYALPLPFIAAQLGWLAEEVGRQPWIVYGVLRTSDAVSRSISAPQVAASLAGFTALYGLLAAIDLYLLCKYARKGPA
ncbi:MAG: cytochrome ubiquinol oxidase subunit I [Thermodesulfovibrionales bacterium]